MASLPLHSSSKVYPSFDPSALSRSRDISNRRRLSLSSRITSPFLSFAFFARATGVRAGSRTRGTAQEKWLFGFLLYNSPHLFYHRGRVYNNLGSRLTSAAAENLEPKMITARLFSPEIYDRSHYKGPKFK